MQCWKLLLSPFFEIGLPINYNTGFYRGRNEQGRESVCYLHWSPFNSCNASHSVEEGDSHRNSNKKASHKWFNVSSPNALRLGHNLKNGRKLNYCRNKTNFHYSQANNRVLSCSFVNNHQHLLQKEKFNTNYNTVVPRLAMLIYSKKIAAKQFHR